MRGIVAVGGDLCGGMIAPVARDPNPSLSLGPIAAVVEHAGDNLESARIAESADDEGRVAADVPVLVRQPVEQGRNHAGLVTRNDLLGNQELLPEDRLALERVHQRARRERVAERRSERLAW